ncbi:uncharacterized protein LOC101849136 [Aplysia californica]|uniref:Uncharacterized protein LOC101849136 n=1 Tax=Aplysia californica TaxID=6500 RepID=A0ABM1VVR5_APLCA|nr:uncharacterized protein LOC101849136 [Aplysia californica]
MKISQVGETQPGWNTEATTSLYDTSERVINSSTTTTTSYGWLVSQNSSYSPLMSMGTDAFAGGAGDGAGDGAGGAGGGDVAAAVEDGEIPMTGILGVAGFVLLDMGFDLSMSVNRAFILEVVPSFQHTRILVVATSVAATGGILFSSLGVFDLSGYLRSAFHVDGMAATILLLSLVQAVFVTASFGSSIFMGHLLHVRHSKSLKGTEEEAGTDHPDTRGGPLVESAHSAYHHHHHHRPRSGSIMSSHRHSVSAIAESKLDNLSGDKQDAESDKQPLLSSKNNNMFNNGTKPLKEYSTFSESNFTSSVLGSLSETFEHPPSCDKPEVRHPNTAAGDTPTNLAQTQSWERGRDVTDFPYQRLDTTESVEEKETPEQCDHYDDSISTSSAVGVIWSLANSLSLSVVKTDIDIAPLGDFHSRKLAQLQYNNNSSSSNNINSNTTISSITKDRVKNKKSKRSTSLLSSSSPSSKPRPTSSSSAASTSSFFNKRVLLFAAATFTSNGTLMSIAPFSANTLTVEILGGDPTATPGTQAYANYELGQRMGSLGILVYYCTYFLASLGNNKFLQLYVFTGIFMGPVMSAVQSAWVPIYYCMISSFIAVSLMGALCFVERK